METRQAIEAMLFVAESPVPTKELAQVLELPAREVTEQLESLQQDMSDRNAGTVLRKVGGGWRIYSHPDALPYLERFASTPTASRLSEAASETLAVIAYRQPVARSQINEIRGVDSESSLHTLERRGLVSEVGRATGPGNAILYGTTDLFLERLGLDSLTELPPLADHVPPAGVVETLEETSSLDR